MHKPRAGHKPVRAPLESAAPEPLAKHPGALRFLSEASLVCLGFTVQPDGIANGGEPRPQPLRQGTTRGGKGLCAETLENKISGFSWVWTAYKRQTLGSSGAPDSFGDETWGVFFTG